MRVPRKTLSVFAAIAIPLFAAGAGVAPTALADGAPTLFVSVQGNDANACTQDAPCATIGHAVSVAAAGDTIAVGHGIYHEDVTITTDLTLVGQDAIVNASQITNGIVISGTGAAGTTVRGFTVENALFEGILAVQTQGVTIQNNVVTNNDQGMFLPPAQQTGECQGFGQVPGDCGEGLHLMTVTNAKVLNNTVTHNSGGILLSDENGPTASNLIAGNRVLNNVYDCGITVVAHLPMQFGGGVHDNTVLGNVVNGNGVQGEGGGILLAAGAPGGGVYSNRILFNTANGNGLAGVTLHKHDPFSNLNGNVIVGNRLSNDALDGWGPGMPGDSDTAGSAVPDHQTTGLLIAAASASAPITGTVVAGNHISNVYYGIWTQNASPISPSANTFVNVTTPVFQQ